MEEGGGPLPFLVWFSLQEPSCLWPAYKAWCECCLCKYSIKGTNPPALGLLLLQAFGIHFSNDNSLYPPRLPHPPRLVY